LLLLQDAVAKKNEKSGYGGKEGLAITRALAFE
jgi:hypothetical protein